MKVPIYILGFLKRYGPMHGYKIKQMIALQVSDFTHIKLPTIYYHLNKMQQAGFVSFQTGQSGKRPEKHIYSITLEGEKEFEKLLKESIEKRYSPDFLFDASIFFFNSINTKEMIAQLERHQKYLKDTITYIEKHRISVLSTAPRDFHKIIERLFSHHILHYKAEFVWVKDTIATFIAI